MSHSELRCDGSDETFDRWTFKNKEGKNPRQSFSDEQILDVLRRCPTYGTYAEFARKHRMSISYVKSIVSRGFQIPRVRRAILAHEEALKLKQADASK